MSGPVTNEEILAYLVDLSANIAQQFAEVLDVQEENFITLKNILNLEVIPELNDLSANLTAQIGGVSEQVTGVLDYLTSEINTGLILNTEQLSEVIVQGNVNNQQINDVSANLTAQIGDVSKQVTGVLDYLTSEINTGLILNTEQLSVVIVQGNIIRDQINDLSADLTAQTNDINTNTNTALSQYTNTINTNTNTALSQYTNTINTNTNQSVSTAVEILQKKDKK